VRRFRLGILNSHPIQYFAPLYRKLAGTDDIEPIVFYCSRQGLEAYRDEGFGDVRVQWDTPLVGGYESHFLKNYSRAPRIGGFATLINPSIVTEIRRARLDALLIHGHAHLTEILGILAGSAFGVPLLFRSDSNVSTRRAPSRERIRRPLVSLLYRSFCGFLTIGTSNREYYAAHGVPERKMFHSPMAVDETTILSRVVSDRAAFLAENGLPDLFPIVFASKMLPRKRVEDLVDAYGALRRSGVRAQLILIGDGARREAVEHKVAVERIPDVSMLGFRNQTELPAWLSIAGVFVLPSEQEPWGLAVHEAMIAGAPVIATNEVGAALDLVVPGVTGFRYEAGDVAALSELLRACAMEPEKSRAMGRAARDLIAGWGYDATIEGIRSALSACAGPAAKML
jgi:glycosyltransferase involved in cell wall biosynthesis